MIIRRDSCAFCGNRLIPRGPWVFERVQTRNNHASWVNKVIAIRRAVLGDGPTLMRLGLRMHDESRYSDLTFDALRAAKSIHHWTTDEAYRVAIAERHGRPVGAMVGAIGRWYFHDAKQASDLALFVEPEHRGSAAALMLVRDFLEWAVANACIEATIATSTGVRSEATGRFLARLGFDACGGVYKQRLRPPLGALQ